MTRDRMEPPNRNEPAPWWALGPRWVRHIVSEGHPSPVTALAGIYIRHTPGDQTRRSAPADAGTVRGLRLVRASAVRRSRMTAGKRAPGYGAPLSLAIWN